MFRIKRFAEYDEYAKYFKVVRRRQGWPREWKTVRKQHLIFDNMT